MDIEEYSTSKMKCRLGCSVCLTRNTSDHLVINSSINKLCLGNNENKKQQNKCDKCKIIPMNIDHECYCNRIKHVKKESIPKLICSKHYSNLNHNDKEKNWFNEIIEFRRENWFDCHSNINNVTYLKDINPLCKYMY